MRTNPSENAFVLVRVSYLPGGQDLCSSHCPAWCRMPRSISNLLKQQSTSSHPYGVGMMQVWVQALVWPVISVSTRWAVPLVLLTLWTAVIPFISCQPLVYLISVWGPFFVAEKLEVSWILCLLWKLSKCSCKWKIFVLYTPMANKICYF